MGRGGGGNVSGNSIIVRRVWERKGRLTDSAIASQNSVSPRMLNGKISKGDEFIRVAVSWIPSHRAFFDFYRLIARRILQSPNIPPSPYLFALAGKKFRRIIAYLENFIFLSRYLFIAHTVRLDGKEWKDRKRKGKEGREGKKKTSCRCVQSRRLNTRSRRLN